MSHPIMFDDDDPTLARVREIALSFPGSAEKVSHGRPVFYTTKIFAHFGGSVKVDDTWIQHGQSILVLPDPSEREALLSEAHTYTPGYLGGSGWIGVDLDGADWTHVRELIDTSYRNTAPAGLVAELESS